MGESIAKVCFLAEINPLEMSRMQDESPLRVHYRSFRPTVSKSLSLSIIS